MTKAPAIAIAETWSVRRRAASSSSRYVCANSHVSEKPGRSRAREVGSWTKRSGRVCGRFSCRCDEGVRYEHTVVMSPWT